VGEGELVISDQVVQRDWEREQREPLSHALADAADRVLDGSYPTPRVDSLRNRVSATATLLGLAGDVLEDLHGLAYERPRAAAEKVRGGQADYALDNHGDPLARAVYRNLSIVTVEAAVLVSLAAHDAVRSFKDGHRGRNPRGEVDGVELGEALVKQADRVLAGEYTPARQVHQPDIDRALRAAVQDNKSKDRELTVLRRRLAKIDKPWLDSYDRKKAG
jgi:hypothetical protein